MAWKLFVDDDADGSRRPAISVENPGWRVSLGLPPVPPDVFHLGDWVVARSHDEAIAAMEARGLPDFVSFDHDLGDGKDGIAVARWIIERDLDDGSLPDGFGYEVHSANPVGRANISGLMESYLRQRTRNSGEVSPA